MIDHLEGRDIITFYFETPAKGEDREKAERELVDKVKSKLNVTVVPKAVDIGYLPRSEKKTNRIFDNRY
jgi:phenylacetate-CoA ligase